MALKLNRKLDNNIPTKIITKPEKAGVFKFCFQGFSMLSNVVLNGKSLSGWSTASLYYSNDKVANLKSNLMVI